MEPLLVGIRWVIDLLHTDGTRSVRPSYTARPVDDTVVRRGLESHDHPLLSNSLVTSPGRHQHVT